MADIFVSYKMEDRERVLPLIAALEAAGHSVWWDGQIGAGSDWRDSIAEALAEARCVIVVWSRHSVGAAGRFVRDEADRAQRRGVYLPVRIDAVEPPLGFGETQALPLMGWKGDTADARWRQLLAAVTAVHDQSLIGRAIRGARPSPVLTRRVALAGGSVVALGAAAGGWSWWRTQQRRGRSIAVLPFDNLSGDARQSYLGEGMAEELRTVLSRLSVLRVIARTSSEAMRGIDAVAAAAKLGVGHILAGSVRQGPASVRVSVQLVDGGSGEQRWSNDFDATLDDVLSVQSTIAQEVAAALVGALGQSQASALRNFGTTNVAAYQLMLRLHSLADQDGEAAARERLALAQAALKLDPRYAGALDSAGSATASLAEFWDTADAGVQRRQLASAERLIRAAVALEPRNGDHWVALGYVQRSQLQLRAARQSYARAVTLTSTANTLTGIAFFMAEVGNAAQALAAASQALALDPLNPDSYAAMGDVRYFSGDYGGCVEALRRMLRLFPQHYYGHYYAALALMWLGRFDEALADAAALPADDTYHAAAETCIHFRAGRKAASDAALATLRTLDTGSVLAGVLAVRGEADAALAILDRMLAQRSNSIMGVFTDPMFDPVRGDPRFRRLLAALSAL